MGEKDFSKIRAKVRAVYNRRGIEKAMKFAKELLGGYSVDSIRSEEYYDRYYMDSIALYINMGDTYDQTIIFRTDLRKFFISNMGVEVELIERTTKYKVI